MVKICLTVTPSVLYNEGRIFGFVFHSWVLRNPLHCFRLFCMTWHKGGLDMENHLLIQKLGVDSKDIIRIYSCFFCI